MLSMHIRTLKCLVSSHSKLGAGKKMVCAIHRPQDLQPVYLLSLFCFHYVLCPGLLAV